MPEAKRKKHFRVKHLANAGVIVHKLDKTKYVMFFKLSDRMSYLINPAVDVDVNKPNVVLR